MEAQRPEIAVVVPTYRRPDRLERLLAALAAQTLAPERWELIVVDNASHDPEVDALVDKLPEFVPCPARVVRIETNRGPAAARNLGWQTAEPPLVAFLDDDIVPDPGWLEAGLAAFTGPVVGVVQGQTRIPDGVDLGTLPPWSMWREIKAAGPHFEACNIFYRRAALETTSGFDEAMRWWGEDTTVGWQVVESGWARSFAAEAGATHDVDIRGPWWFLSNGWLEHHVIELAARHPGYRREAFWRPWAVRKRDAAFVLAAVSGVVALRWRPAALGVLPYLWWGRPAMRPGQFLQRSAATVAIDAARAAGHAAGALKHRILVI